MFLEASQVKLFYFIPFGRKRLQTTSKTGGETLPNEALKKNSSSGPYQVVM